MRCARIFIAVVGLGVPGLAFGQTSGTAAPAVKCMDGTLAAEGPDACDYQGGLAKTDALPTKKTPVTVQQELRIAPQTPVVVKAEPRLVDPKGELADPPSR